MNLKLDCLKICFCQGTVLILIMTVHTVTKKTSEPVGDFLSSFTESIYLFGFFCEKLHWKYEKSTELRLTYN